MNICDNVNKQLNCTSCQVCAAICPTNAISIILDKKGFYKPLVNKDKCIDCSLCTKVCYKENDIKISNSSIEHYAAYSNDQQILSSTTSGGIAYLLATQLVQEGYKCVGVVYDNKEDIAKDKIAKSLNEVQDFKGSKYIQSYTLDAFKEILNNNIGDKIAVFGTPCHIYAIDRFLRLKNKRENFILIDIYCHGCPSLNIWLKYIKEVKKKIKKNRIDKVEFRSKIKGWGLFYVVVVVDGAKAFVSSIKNDEFYSLFFSNHLLNDSCYNCTLRGTLAYSDIRLGDFWGEKYIRNSKGVSVVSVNTERGVNLFNQIKQSINYKKHELEDFISFQSYGTKYEYDEVLRNRMFELLQDDSIKLSEIVEFYNNKQSLSEKLKRYIKLCVMFLPQGLIRECKYLYYTLR